MSDIKIDIVKGVIAFFLILNVITLGFGYYLIDNKFNSENSSSSYDSELAIVLRKRETLLEEISIVNKSKEDVYANLKELEQNISMLKKKINDSTLEFSSISDQTQYYTDKLSLLQNQNAQLINQRNMFQNQLNVKNEQAAAAQLKAQQSQVTTTPTTSTTTPPKRTTRAS